MKLVLNKFILFLFIVVTCISCKRPVQSQEQFTSEIENRVEAPIENIPTDLHANFRYNFKHATLISWNIQHLGQSKNDAEIEFIVNILKDFDIVAIQEVVAKHPAGAQKVAQIADELNRTGTKWDYQISDPTKSPSAYMSERYAFLWKTSKVQLIHRAYLDKELEDKCYREPFVAKFRLKGNSDPFYIINYHSRKYNDKPYEEIIHFLEFPERLNSERIIIAGDFNLNEKHKVWQPFYENGFKNALNDQPTTLKMKCKDNQYLNHAIDNFYYTSQINQIQSGAIDFIRSCNNLEQARGVSDHLPVYLEFNFE